MAEKSRLRRSISRWANSSDMLARDMLKTYVEPGKDTIAEAEDRARVRLQGTLRTVTLRPRGGVPALEAELFDGTDGVTLVWIGRRRIPGIEPGRTVRVKGRLAERDGRKVLYNPHYELQCSS